MTFILDGNVLQLDTPFDHNGTSYPANWLRLSTPEQRAEIGITERIDYPRPDDRFYWVSQNPDGTWNAVPKNLDELKSIWTEAIKQSAYSLLATSDWLFIRKMETGVEIPADWTSYRNMVRESLATNISNIQGSMDIENFISNVNGIVWPAPPSTPDAQ